MYTSISRSAVAAVFAGVSLAMAAPASADPLSGPYTATVLDGGGHIKEGVTKTWTFTPCGADCTHWQSGGTKEADLHLQGDSWTGTIPWVTNGSCDITIDKGSLVFTQACSTGTTFVWQLAKGG